jgi:hypothetical protein
VAKPQHKPEQMSLAAPHIVAVQNRRHTVLKGLSLKKLELTLVAVLFMSVSQLEHAVVQPKQDARVPDVVDAVARFFTHLLAQTALVNMLEDNTMNNEYDITDEELRSMVHFLTLRERPESRDKWLQRGFRKFHSRGDNALFDYWKNRIQTDSDSLNFVLESIPVFREGVAEANGRQKEEDIDLPPLVDMVGSAAKAAYAWVKSGFVTTDEQTLIKRIEACMGCEFWDAAAFRGTGRCKKCGCSTQAKLRMATEKCPIGKW